MELLFGFSGRIGRIQYWLTGFGTFAYFIILMMIGYAITPGPAIPTPDAQASHFVEVFWKIAIFLLPAIWVNISALIRRYHDRNKSGWWYFICLVPIVGPIWQLIELGFLAGTPGANDYGTRGGMKGKNYDNLGGGYSDQNFARMDDLINRQLQENQRPRQAEPVVQRRSNGFGQPSSPPAFGRRGLQN